MLIRTDLHQSASTHHLTAMLELPGVKKSDLRVSLSDDPFSGIKQLTVTGRSALKFPHESDGWYLVRERKYGDFKRVLVVPPDTKVRPCLCLLVRVLSPPPLPPPPPSCHFIHRLTKTDPPPGREHRSIHGGRHPLPQIPRSRPPTPRPRVFAGRRRTHPHRHRVNYTDSPFRFLVKITCLWIRVTYISCFSVHAFPPSPLHSAKHPLHSFFPLPRRACVLLSNHPSIRPHHSILYSTIRCLVFIQKARAIPLFSVVVQSILYRRSV